MKYNKSKLIEYTYYFSLIALFILYLFPGSILGYFFYGDLTQQPNIIENPIGTSINHFFFFVYLTTLGTIYNSQKNNFFNNIYFILLIAIILECLHFLIPDRAFEYNDLIANIAGVLIIFMTKKLIK
jgi:VanZ family protein|tara:strand:- start:145 stop:525 length:381 start_codon:yes stop_codon:yes gene_type:complete